MLERFLLIYITTFCFIGTCSICSFDFLQKTQQTYLFGIYNKFVEIISLNQLFRFNFCLQNMLHDFKYYKIIFILIL